MPLVYWEWESIGKGYGFLLPDVPKACDGRIAIARLDQMGHMLEAEGSALRVYTQLRRMFPEVLVDWTGWWVTRVRPLSHHEIMFLYLSRQLAPAQLKHALQMLKKVEDNV